MPHISVEYTDNLPQFHAAPVLLALNQALLGLGHFEEQDIKSRAIRLDAYQTGTQPAQRAFVHVKLAILSGRSAQIKSVLSDCVLRALQGACEWPSALQVQLSVEVVDMDRGSYAKAVIG